MAEARARPSAELRTLMQGLRRRWNTIAGLAGGWGSAETEGAAGGQDGECISAPCRGSDEGETAAARLRRPRKRPPDSRRKIRMPKGWRETGENLEHRMGCSGKRFQGVLHGCGI